MHDKAPGRFRFTIRDNANFNARFIIDVIYIRKKPVLYAVNKATAFQAAKFLTNMQANITWNIFRTIWINIYLGSPDIIIINASANFKGNFVNNAKNLAIKIEKVPVETHNSIDKIERYHDPMKRAYEIITFKLGNTISPKHALQMAIKAINDIAGLNGLVFILLVFGAFPRISHILPPFPLMTARGKAIRKIMAEAYKLKAARQMANALAIRNGPNIEDVLRLPLMFEIRVYRENKSWSGPYKLIAYDGNRTECTVDVNGKNIRFRVTSVRPYYHNEHTAEPKPAKTEDSNDESDKPGDKNYRPKESEKPNTPKLRRRKRPPGSKNKPKVNPKNVHTHNTANIFKNGDPLVWQYLLKFFIGSKITPNDSTISANFEKKWEIFLTRKKHEDAQLAEKFRRKDKITTPDKPFELLNQTEINALIAREIFRFEQFDLIKHGNIRIFKSRIINEVKCKTTDKPYEKSRLVIQDYKNKGKFVVLTQSPTIKRSSQRILLAIAPSLVKKSYFI
jgi:hypothetical protein